MRDMPLAMRRESVKLEQSALIELFDVDLIQIGGDYYRFHAGTNELRGDVIWKCEQYRAYPVQATGFEFNGRGTSNRPKLSFANVSGLMTGLNATLDDMVGGIVTRRLIYAHHLDEANFLDGNPQADPTQEVISRYVIERSVSLDRQFATYELSLPSEPDGAQIPARIITTDICAWQYRKDGCGYVGGPVADESDNPVDTMEKDRCGKRLSSCKLRFKNGSLPFGGFPTARRIK
ncbi:phage minor tail protein L [Salinivibrio socompensis]|uniref:phage minor tail protein L n=1 Tax=Salinivibrio socompensis TaxID=1510206 RepID=UPI000471D3FC|nr:phage minor tail protein L [Salinivibrio socompensis]